LVRVIVLTVVSIWTAGTSAQSKKLRYLSFAAQDRLPQVQEAKDYYNGVKSLDQLIKTWLEGEGHRLRVTRYFGDMFGVATNIIDTAYGESIRLNDLGVYQDQEECGAEGVDVEAWWLEKGETVKVCPDLVSDSLLTGPTAAGNWQGCVPDNPNFTCGCGPKLIHCYPWDVMRGGKEELFKTAITDEFKDRGWYVYQEDLSWEDLFSGQFIYGNRYLAFTYFVLDFYDRNQPTLGDGPPDMSEDIEAVISIPTDSKKRLDLTHPLRRRYGILTSPGYYKQHTTYRSQINGLVQKLLCQPISGSLNTDRTATIHNEDTAMKEKVVERGTACASCHYVLDNMISVLGNYYQGRYTQKNYTPPLSEVGHVFGKTGEGVGFLLKRIQSHRDFLPCMAKTAWEDFSGIPWSSLSKGQQVYFKESAGRGPRTLIRDVLQSKVIRNVR
jgi:hypothetical protein